MAGSDAARSPVPTVVPRGRHAPPLEVRLTVQRRRLFEEAATEVMRQMALASAQEAGTYDEHLTAGTRAFLRTLAEWPDAAQTLLVEIIGAGPRATERRDAILDAFADAIYRDNERIAPKYGGPRF